jgi:hypothetical protein
VGHDPAVADLRRRRRLGGPSRENGLERPAHHDGRRRDGQALALQHGGHNVQHLDLLADAPPRRPSTRELHHEGDSDELVEDAPAVQPLPVIEELLAVIAEEDDER